MRFSKKALAANSACSITTTAQILSTCVNTCMVISTYACIYVYLHVEKRPTRVFKHEVRPDSFKMCEYVYDYMHVCLYVYMHVQKSLGSKQRVCHPTGITQMISSKCHIWGNSDVMITHTHVRSSYNST